MEGAGARDHLPTERPNPASAELDRLPLADAFDVLNAEDATVAAAVRAAKAAIVRAAELVAERLAAGGRLVYVGAGTSGRLGLLDAVECPPTFGTAPEQVQAVLAGGEAALVRAVEGAEDSRDAGRAAIAARSVGARDVVFGIAAGGTTPFVHGALAEARARGAAAVFLACVSAADVPDEADVSIRVVTGPEAIGGSTRMKAGTATKLVLNTVTTLAMTRLGKVHGNLMVDVHTAGNAKLWSRGVELVRRLTEADRGDAERLLREAGGSVKVAVLMGHLGLDPRSAQARLDAAKGHLREALDGRFPPRPGA
jgi:N-acetylmuramic acid 6-phosphate etherase